MLQAVISACKSSQWLAVPHAHAKIHLPAIILTAYYASDGMNPSHNYWNVEVKHSHIDLPI